MNKTLTLILIIVAVLLIGYNATRIDYQDPLGEDSIIALIGIVAALSAIVLLLIFRTSKKIEDKVDEN